MYIGVDCDLTVVDEIIPRWWGWLQGVTGKIKTCPHFLGRETNYDLTSYFKEDLEAVGLDGLEWWRSSTLYDDMSTIYGAQIVLEALYNAGHEIVFISTVKGSHHKSKYYFLKRHFPYMRGFVATKEKDLVSVDVMIDDRHKCLNLFQDREVLCIKRNTNFTQCEPLKTDTESFDHWLQVLDILKVEI